MKIQLPKVIRVERRGPTAHITVDGEPFPFPVAYNPPPTVSVSTSEMPSITITLFADRVEVSDLWQSLGKETT